MSVDNFATEHILNYLNILMDKLFNWKQPKILLFTNTTKLQITNETFY